MRIYDYEVKVRQDSSGLSASDSGTLPVPMVFLAVQFRPIKHLSFEAEGRGITYGGNDVYSLIGRVKVGLVGPLFVAGGYRYEKVKLDERDISADLEISGPFLETGFSFQAVQRIFDAMIDRRHSQLPLNRSNTSAMCNGGPEYANRDWGDTS